MPVPYLAIGSDTVHVDPVVETHDGRGFRIGVGALNPQAVHPVLEGGPGRPNDHPCPVLQVNVVLILQTPTKSGWNRYMYTKFCWGLGIIILSLLSCRLTVVSLYLFFTHLPLFR